MSKEIFSRNLRKYMVSKSKNQKDIADILGVSAPTVNDWIKGRKFPRIDKLETLAKYFGVAISDLIDGESDISLDSPINIGDTIYRQRMILGLTLEDIGNAVGVSKSTVKKWESGFISNMRRDKIAKLAQILELSISDLVTIPGDSFNCPNTFGKKLKQLRISRRLSQQALADILGTSKQVISRYELNQNSPKFSVVSKWCEILGVSIESMTDTSIEKDRTGYRIKCRRKELGISAEELASTANTSVSTIYRYENGEIDKIPSDILKTIAAELRTTPDFLMGLSEEAIYTPPIGERIRERRTEIGLSQERLAKLAGYQSRASINKIELGKRNITTSMIQSVADILQITPTQLMGWNGDLKDTDNVIDSSSEHDFTVSMTLQLDPVTDSDILKLLDLNKPLSPQIKELIRTKK